MGFLPMRLKLKTESKGEKLALALRRLAQSWEIVEANPEGWQHSRSFRQQVINSSQKHRSPEVKRA
jgi:hypothetical protein